MSAQTHREAPLTSHPPPQRPRTAPPTHRPSKQFGLFLSKRGKTASVDRAWPKAADGLEMLGRRIALMLAKSIAGMQTIVLVHQTVAGHFGQNARRGNREAQPITLDDCRLGTRQARHAEAVHQGMFGRFRESLQGHGHRPVGRPQDVGAVDFSGLELRKAKDNSVVRVQRGKELLPPTRSKALRIVKPVESRRQPGSNQGDRQDDGSRHHGAGQRTAPDFVDPGDPCDSPPEKRPLVVETIRRDWNGGHNSRLMLSGPLLKPRYRSWEAGNAKDECGAFRGSVRSAMARPSPIGACARERLRPRKGPARSRARPHGALGEGRSVAGVQAVATRRFCLTASALLPIRWRR